MKLVSTITRVGGQRRAQLAHGADAVQPRHHQVHQDDVGRSALGLAHGRLAVGRLAHDLDAVLELEERAQPLADDGVVVDDQDADRQAPAPPAGPSCPRRAPESIVQPRRRAARRAPPSTSARGGASAERRRRRGRSRCRRRRPRARARRRRSQRAPSTRAPPGVADRVVQRLLGDAQDLAVARRRRPARPVVDVERRSPAACSAAQRRRRACAARRASPSRSRSGGRSSTISDAQLAPAPRARAPAAASSCSRAASVVAAEQRRRPPPRSARG